MKNILNSVIALIALLSVNAAKAQNPHEQAPTTYHIDNQGHLVVCYDISGLGNVSSLPATISFDATTTTYCYNKGNDSGPVPGQTKTDKGVQVPIIIKVTNGRATDCHTVTPDEYSSTCGSCPGGFARSECTTSFSNVSLTINYGNNKTRTFTANPQ